MQGRYIAHQALRALGSKERITSVTSFKAKDPLVKDDSNLNTTRGISDVAELYYEFGEYRLEMLEERIRAKLKTIRKHHTAGKRFDECSFKAFLREQEAFLKATDAEILEYENVVAGHQPELDLPNVVPAQDDTHERSSKRVKV